MHRLLSVTPHTLLLSTSLQQVHAGLVTVLFTGNHRKACAILYVYQLTKLESGGLAEHCPR